jgi:acetylserotonin N-methyltransferase
MTTSPEIVLDLIDAFRRSKTMFAAVELGIFDGARPAGHKELPRLLDACVSLGLLEKQGEEYRNSAVAEKYLKTSSPDTLSGYVRYSNRALYPMWAHLEDAVREGTHRWTQTFGLDGSLFSMFFRDDESAKEFLLGMHGFGQLTSESVVTAFDLSRFHRLVDLGGATGHLAAAVRARYPHLEAITFDLPAVARLFHQVTPGDFFTDPLPESDLYALGRILHDWAEEKIRALLLKICAALPAGGGLLLAEKILREDKTGPAHANMQSLNMLVVTEGRERTLSEYRALLEEAGFTSVEGRITGAPLDAILAIK